MSIVIVAWVVATITLAQPAVAAPEVVFSRRGDIFTVAPDGSGVRRIANRPAAEHMPTWSPGHDRVAFLSWSRRIVIVDADGARPPGDLPAPAPVRGHHGPRLVARRNAYRVRGRAREGPRPPSWPEGLRPGPVDPSTGGSTHVVINGEPHITGISWSPDGEWLAVGFEHQNMTRACGDDRPLGIARVRLDGSGLRGLGPDLATDPDWSPDGRWIAYRDWRRTCHACGEIWVVRPDGTRDHVLTPVPASEGGLRQPRYSPSGRRLIALGDGIWVIDGDGTLRRRIVAHATSIDW